MLSRNPFKLILILGALVLSLHDFSVAQSNHPRLWLRTSDIARLRSWAVSTNPTYQEALIPLLDEAKRDMDSGFVPARDMGTREYEDYPTEMYAELFAFMSLIHPDQAQRNDFAQRARTLLMYVMNEAAKGPAEGQPFRGPSFYTEDSNRSRWHGEAFGLVVDWIYPTLTVNDKAIIRKVFLRWAREIVERGYHHPDPIDVLNNPVLLQDSSVYRWAGNNYFTGHMRNLGLMAMCFDAADDPGDSLRNYLKNATGAWLYMFDHVSRNDCKGGLLPEGFEYSPQTAGYVTQFHLAMKTAGLDNPSIHGQQVLMNTNPFWDDFITAYFHSLSPGWVPNVDHGEVFQPAWYGDGLNYFAEDFMNVFGPLALYDQYAGRTDRVQPIRWIQLHLAPGRFGGLMERARNSESYMIAILYFLLFDPTTVAPTDPRTAYPLSYYVPGIERIFSRTSWNEDARWFTYMLSWNLIDHQHGTGNMIEFYRNGEWLTKERTGYGDAIGCSDYKNTVCIRNDPPDHTDDIRMIPYQRGSQWLLVSSSDPKLVAHSLKDDFMYACGDATNLYNSVYELSTDVRHASRSVVWLKPDHVIVYDRAETKTQNRFKRFWLNLPQRATISGKLATVITPKGQKLYITNILPEFTDISSDTAETLNGEPANYEPMQYRYFSEPTNIPLSTRFLHVLQGADQNVSASATTLVRSTSGNAFEGVAVRGAVILFPTQIGEVFTGLTYAAPSNIAGHLITGLTPNAGYTVNLQTSGNITTVTIMPNGTARADSGGVLLIGKLTSMESEYAEDAVKQFELQQNFPNPFSERSTIRFTLSALEQTEYTVPTRLRLFDIYGRRIATLLDEVLPAGEHAFTIDTKKHLSAPGIYFYKLQSGANSQVRSMIIVR